MCLKGDKRRNVKMHEKLVETILVNSQANIYTLFFKLDKHIRKKLY